MPRPGSSLSRRSVWRAGLTALASAVPLLALTGAVAPASAATPPRVTLPSPTPADVTGTPTPLGSAQPLTLRVYLSGSHPAGRLAAALAVSDPGGPAYTHYLTPAQYEQRYGPTAAQAQTVSRWLAAQGMTVTAITSHYVAVDATVAQADAAFHTQVSQYVFSNTIGGQTFTSRLAGTAGGLSVPAALAADVAAVTGIEQTTVTGSSAGLQPGHTQSAQQPAPAGASAARATAAHTTAGTTTPGATTSSGYQCSQYWKQHAETIPAAYGRTSAPTQLCGYTPAQMRRAYGIASSPYTGKGATIAIVLDGASPTMLADANRFFASHGVPGFARGQYTENTGPTLTSSCGSDYSDEPEEALDVETAHIAAPQAKIVYVGADCDNVTGTYTQQNLLDAMTRVTDQHLANVVTESFSIDESSFSAADTVAWNLTFEQGALEGIGFNFDSGDGGANIGALPAGAPSVTFPASDPWATAVGGTSLEIGRDGTAVADYPWGDNGTQVDPAGTGYTSPPPGLFLEGSTGGVSTLFAEPAYQKPVVPAALATGGGTGAGRRVVPDIAADAGSSWLIGYTGAVTAGAYAQIPDGGTSGASPLIAGLEADAMQAAGHPLGFANPALYRLCRSPAIHDIPPVNPASPPAVIGGQPYFGSATNYLTTLGEDSPPLQATAGYDDVTGLGAPGNSFVTAFTRF